MRCPATPDLEAIGVSVIGADRPRALKDKAKLTSVLMYHVVRGKVPSKDIKPGKVKSLQGSELTIATMGGFNVDAVKVTAADVLADDGVLHVIDKVLFPR